MLQSLVLFAEAATLAFVILFCTLIASDGMRGPVFEIHVADPVGRTLIRNAQIAFVVGYGAFFVSTIAIAFGLL